MRSLEFDWVVVRERFVGSIAIAATLEGRAFRGTKIQEAKTCQLWICSPECPSGDILKDKCIL